jgi:hypothetical protein
LKGDTSANGNPFHRHSTLLGTLAAFVVVTLLGWATQWRVELVAVYGIAFVVSFLLFARLFYGFRASRTLDKEPISPGSGWTRRDDWHQETSHRLFDAYEKAQEGDVSGLKRLAEEEESSQVRDGDSTVT